MRDQIKKHQDCIEILEAIEYYERLQKVMFEFPINGKTIHKFSIYKKCKERLSERYDKLKATL